MGGMSVLHGVGVASAVEGTGERNELAMQKNES